MIPEELEGVLERDPEVMSGAVCFVGTRVPVQALLDSMFRGLGLEDFLVGFPDVSREKAEAVLRWEQNEARRVFGLDLVA